MLMEKAQSYAKLACILVIVTVPILFYTVTPSLPSWPTGAPSINFSAVGSLIPLLDPLRDKQKPKIILDWCGFFGDPLEKCGWLNDCPEDNCKLSSDKRKLSEADALVFHIRDFSWGNVPPTRYQWQRYVFFLHESPRHTGLGNLDKIPGFFNWTLTYRTDSDLPLRYGGITYHNSSFKHLKLLSNTTSSDETNKSSAGLLKLVSNKKLPIIWFVSNCGTPSRREDYVRQLQRYVRVDIFGNCGSPNCSRGDNDKCNAMLERDYYFYIVFENSICKDYITEKIWTRLHLWSVPLVLDRAIYREHIPDEAFIAVSDFKSAAAMAERLKYLMKHPAEYIKYFQWRYDAPVYLYDFFIHRGAYMCHLCKSLWNNTLPAKAIYNLKDWWERQAHCQGSQFVQSHIL